MIRTRWLAAGLVALVVLVVAGILLLRADRPGTPRTADGRESGTGATGGAAVPATSAREDSVASPATIEAGGAGETAPSEAVGCVVGVVLDPDGKPVSGATAWAFRAPFRGVLARGTINVPSGEGGGFRIDGLDLGGVYEITAEHGRHQSERRQVVPTRDAPVVTVELLLRRPASVMVRPLGPDGLPPAWARAGPAGLTLGGHDSSTEVVVALLDWLPGVHSIEVRAAGCTPEIVEIEFREGEARDVVVRLKAGTAISGTVIDDASEPVPRAWIECYPASRLRPGETPPYPHEAVADDRGRFRLDGLAPGALRVRAHGPTHESGWIEGFAAPAEDVVLPAPRQGAISVKFLLPEGSVTPPRVEVVETPIHVWPYLPGGIPPFWRAMPWPAGDRLRLEGLPAGSRPLGIRVEGFVPISRIVEVPPGATLDLGEIRLDPGLTLRGRVTDGEDRPIAGAEVSLGLDDAVETDTAGRFSIPHLPPGPLYPMVRAEGFASAYPEMELGPESAPIRIRLDRGGLVRGRVVDATGKPAPGLTIFVGSHDEWNEAVSEGPIVTDHRGRFSFRHPTGSYVIAIMENNRIVGRSAEVVLTEGDEVDVRLVDPR